MNRGEVWWAESPEGGRRPYLILTRPQAIEVLRYLVAVPVTRTIRRIPSEVVIDKDDGMPQLSALTLDNVTTMPKAFFTSRICRLNPQRMDEVCRALRVATAC